MHHLWIRQSVLNVDNVIVIAALLYNNLAMTSPYWCPPSRLCLLVMVIGCGTMCTLYDSWYKQVRFHRWCMMVITENVYLASSHLQQKSSPPYTWVLSFSLGNLKKMHLYKATSFAVVVRFRKLNGTWENVHFICLVIINTAHWNKTVILA